MLFGYFEHILDDKGRLMVPSKLREELGSKIYILKGFDGALAVYKEEAFIKLTKEIESLPFNVTANRSYLRLQLASVCELAIDKLGRVSLPSMLLSKYGIGKEVCVIGVLDHLEIWDKKAYQAYEQVTNSNFESIAESIKKTHD